MKFVRTITLFLGILLIGVILCAAELVDINRATLPELRTLPGIGEAYALAIVKHRPYKNKTQLRSKGAIPLAAYNKIKKQIIAKQ